MPVDIHELIVYYVTAAEPMGPPHGLLALASTCWKLYYSLSIKHNALVYADTFRLKFDTAAPLRRFASESPAVEARTSTSGLASELRARFGALHYMRAVVDSQNVFCFSERETLLHLWTIYFMCIESDSKNQKYLVTYGQMRTYARLCMDQYLFQSLDAPDLLPETTERSLMMWISWFSTTWEDLYNEDLQYENRMIQFLRPLNYANFNYTAYFAPWMLYDLPTKSSALFDGYSSLRRDRYAADTDPKDRSCTITLYGAALRITPPLLVHAALLAYFARLEKRAIFEGIGTYGMPANYDQNAHHTFRLPHLQDSKIYDLDFYRLCTCLDPRTSRGLPGTLLNGTFAGDWEGRFSFTDFDSFRDMLDGDDDAIHSSTIAQQPQVWTIREHHHPLTRSPVPSSSPGSRASTSTSTSSTAAIDGANRPPAFSPSKPIALGPSLNGHLPEEIEIKEPTARSHVQRRPSRSRLAAPVPGPVPAATAPKPIATATYIDPSTGLRTQTSYSTWSPPRTLSSEGIGPPLHERVPVVHTLLRDAVHSMGLREKSRIVGYPDPYGFSTYSHTPAPGSDTSASSSVAGGTPVGSMTPALVAEEMPQDIVLTGKGHSAWGPFTLKGRVRPWDGMINIVKSYAGNESRGTWLYRGYILDSGIWVGRWRDTMTEETTNGYEGVFAMTKRSSTAT